jgi:putative FmdB family regulatory protein
MPTYEYRCPEGHDFEKFFRTISSASSAAATFPCPQCGAEAARLMSGGAALMFKGSGFYLTDYGKNAHASKPPAKSDGKSDGADKGASEATKSPSDKGASDRGASDKSASGKTGSASESAKPAAKKPAE